MNIFIYYKGKNVGKLKSTSGQTRKLKFYLPIDNFVELIWGKLQLLTFSSFRKQGS